MDYSKLADSSVTEKIKTVLVGKGYDVTLVSKKGEALEKIKEIIPKGASVMNGSSVTLGEIGYMDYLKSGAHSWVDLHAKTDAENDPKKRAELRRESVLSDFYLGSVAAITEEGEMIIASNTGSQLPQIAFTSPNIIFVISTKKIVPDFNEAMKRINEYVIPIENKRMMEVFGMPTALNKILIFKGEAPFLGRKIHIIIVEEELGY